MSRRTAKYKRGRETPDELAQARYKVLRLPNFPMRCKKIGVILQYTAIYGTIKLNH